MDETRDPDLNPVFFVEKAKEFFASVHMPNLSNAKQAEDFIDAIDVTIDALTDHLRETGLTYSDKTIVYFGAPLGEAFRILFNGMWKFSNKQNRWVIEISKDKDFMEMNIFRKIEKRIENGMEDSISYYLAGIKNIIIPPPGDFV